MSQDQTSSSLLLETIKIEEGKVHNLSYHQARCDKSRQALFKSTDILKLSSLIQPPKTGCYRCRIVYGEALHSIAYIPYIPKKIDTLKIVPSEISYDFKYEDREPLNALLNAHNNVDEVIIEKEGYLSDTTVSNIAFYDGKQWFTPEKPLLEGTMRAKLIDEGMLQLSQIKKEDLARYTHVALINAMLGFKILTIHSIQNIIKGVS